MLKKERIRVKRENNTPRKQNKLTEKIAASPFGEVFLIALARVRAKRSQTPTHFYYECQYFAENEPYQSCVGYLSAGTKEASLRNMRFIRADGTQTAEGEICASVQHLAVKPYGGELMYVRRQAVESGTDIFGKVINNTREPILFYKLDKNGKAVSGPRRLSERAKLLRTQTCYLFTDENRSFTLYLTGSRNELWKLPTF